MGSFSLFCDSFTVQLTYTLWNFCYVRHMLRTRAQFGKRYRFGLHSLPETNKKCSRVRKRRRNRRVQAKRLLPSRERKRHAKRIMPQDVATAHLRHILFKHYYRLATAALFSRIIERYYQRIYTVGRLAFQNPPLPYQHKSLVRGEYLRMQHVTLCITAMRYNNGHSPQEKSNLAY